MNLSGKGQDGLADTTHLLFASRYSTQYFKEEGSSIKYIFQEYIWSYPYISCISRRAFCHYRSFFRLCQLRVTSNIVKVGEQNDSSLAFRAYLHNSVISTRGWWLVKCEIKSIVMNYDIDYFRRLLWLNGDKEFNNIKQYRVIIEQIIVQSETIYLE